MLSIYEILKKLEILESAITIAGKQYVGEEDLPWIRSAIAMLISDTTKEYKEI